MASYLAVDVGGTSTRAVVVDEAGRCRGYGATGRGNPTAAGAESAAAAIAHAVTDALAAAESPATTSGWSVVHISPAGIDQEGQPRRQVPMEHGVQPLDFNSYGSRRGNDRVMTRGTFANIRLRNLLAPGTEGGVTTLLGKPGELGDEVMSIYDAAMKYKAASTSRWSCWPARTTAWAPAATGPPRATFLLGVKAVIAESFERIHRSNLVGMGVLPLQFMRGQNRAVARPDRHGTFEIQVGDDLKPLQDMKVRVTNREGDADRVHRRPAASIRRSRSSTTATAASCTRCCGRC